MERVLGVRGVHLLEKGVIRPSGCAVSGWGADRTVGPSTPHPGSEATLSFPQIQSVPHTCLPGGKGRKAAALLPGRDGPLVGPAPSVGGICNLRPCPCPALQFRGANRAQWGSGHCDNELGS